MQKLLPILYFLVFVFSICAQGEWNQFRGSSGQGHSNAALPQSWSQHSKNIKWRTAIDGKAWSSPILVSGEVVVTNARSNGSGDSIILEALCLDSENGKIIWRNELFSYSELPRIHRKNSYASPTPFFDGDSIFVHFGNLGTACLNQKGELRWKKVFKYSPVHGSGCSPVVYGKQVLFSADGASDPCLYAINKLTGDILWQAPRIRGSKKTFSFCTPLVVPFNGSIQIISPASDFVYSYSLDGKELWRLNYPNGYSVVPRPVYQEGVVYVCSGYDRPTLYAIEIDGRGDVTKSKILWQTSKSVPRNSSVVLVNGNLFMAADNGVVSCLDAKTGRLYWIERVGGSCSASLLHANDLIYLTDETGKTFVFEANTQYKFRFENDINERTLSSIMTLGTSIILRTESAVYRIEHL